MFIGLFLIIIGAVFLLKNLGIITGEVWGIIWPLSLIIFGVYLALKNCCRKLFWEKIQKKFEGW